MDAGNAFQPSAQHIQLVGLLHSPEEKMGSKEVKEIMALDLPLERKEYRRLCRTDLLKKAHVYKHTLLMAEYKKKLGTNDKIIQQDYFRTQTEVLSTLLKKNLSSDNNTHHQVIVSTVEALIEKFQKEPHFIIFLNIVDFQECISLLLAFFFKLVNNYHKLYLEFFNTFANFDRVKFSLVVQQLFHVYNAFKGVSFMPLEFKLNETHFHLKKVQHHVFTLLWKLLQIKESVSPDNVYEKITNYNTLGSIFSRSDKLLSVRKFFEFYFLTHKFDESLALLLKDYQNKNFEHPFETHFRQHLFNDPLTLVLLFIISLNSKSSNINELFLFYIFYIHKILPDDENKDTSHDWHIQFLINGFVLKKQLSRTFVYLSRQIHLFRNCHKKRLVHVIGIYMIDNYSMYTHNIHNDYNSILYNIVYESIDDIYVHMHEISKCIFDTIN